MGSLMSGWDIPADPPPLSVEEELKIQQVQLDRQSLGRRNSGPLEGRPSLEEKHTMLFKVAEKQNEAAGPPSLARVSGGPPNLQRKSAPMKVKIRGHKGSTVVLESEPVTPGNVTPRDENAEEGEGNPLMVKDKWWRKLSSSALNEMDKDVGEDTGDGSTYVPQFDLTGSNPYTKGVEVGVEAGVEA